MYCRGSRAGISTCLRSYATVFHDEIYTSDLCVERFVDLDILARTLSERVASNILQRTLDDVNSWCQREHLSVNYSETVIVPFNRRRNLQDLVPFSFNGELIRFPAEVKYPGFIFDGKLTWNAHLTRNLLQSQTVHVNISKDLREALGFRAQTNPLDICDDYQTCTVYDVL